MGRPGITYHDVSTAAQHLVGQGKNPTIELIRAHLKTGSSSTITPFLRTWKSRQGETQQLAAKENIPGELVALLKGLWERLIEQAQMQVVAIEEKAEQDKTTLSAQLQEFRDKNTHWQQQYSQLEHAKNTLANDKLSLEEAVAGLKKENDLLQVKQDNLLEQRQSQQERIEELSRLNQQVQANLEHYRESAREQRLADQQRSEQQQQQLEETIHQLRQNLNTHQQTQQALQQQYNQSCYEKENLHAQHEAILSENTTLQSTLRVTEKEKIQALQAQEDWQSQCQIAKAKIDEQYVVLVELQKQVAVFTEKIKTSQEQLQKIETQNKLLANEKWVLGEEKAQLIGQIKQLKLNMPKK